MEIQELKNIWNDYDKKLEQVLSLNRRCLEMLQSQKAVSAIRRLMVQRKTGIVLGIVWILLLGMLAIAGRGNFFFSASLGMIILITLIAVVIYIKDIVLISQISQSENIVYTQEKLTALQLSVIRCVRISFLQLPFYTTFFLSPKMLAEQSVGWDLLLLLITGSFTFLALWLYREIDYSNLHKKWVRALLRGSGGPTAEKALAFMKDIHQFKDSSHEQ